MQRDRTFLSAFWIALALALAAPAAAGAGDAERPFLVKMHADWCGTCTALEPTWAALESAHGAKLRMVTFDVTDRARLTASRAEAEKLGLLSFFEGHRGRTGLIALLDAKGEPIELFHGVRDPAAYEPALIAAVAGGAK